MKINEPETPPPEAPLWRLAFRTGFLLAGAFAVLGMARWLHWMWQPQSWDFTLFPAWWHAHEMIFGFAMPVVAGFLLSAVATWTGIPGTTGWRLKVLFGLWVIARTTLWLLPGQLLLAWLAEMLFFGLLIYELTLRVWAVRQWRNMLFPPVLLALALLSSASYWNAGDPLFSARLHYGAVWMITVLVVIIGGRVTPLFTGNRLGFRITPLPAWFESLAIGTTALIGLVLVFWPQEQSSTVLALLCLVAGVIHSIRLAHWQGWKTLRVPLLWSMHLSYLCIPLAMFALALVGADPVASKNVIHLLAIGTIGGMILAMMSRVSLGHTGRPLEVPAYLSLAFGLVILAAMIRAVLPLVDVALTLWAWQLSALLWIVAFSLFLVRYIPVLTQPRVDSKPG
ncbi:MAG: NnrS family protein [Halioglobus sp.]|nr:NnrS family protein [Halioglobus sp.]